MPTNIVTEDLQRSSGFTVSQSCFSMPIYQASGVGHDASKPDIAPFTCISEPQPMLNTPEIEPNIRVAPEGKVICRRNHCMHEKAALTSWPISAAFDGFSDFASGIVSVAELGNMAGIIQREDLETRNKSISSLSLWIRKPQGWAKTEWIQE